MTIERLKIKPLETERMILRGWEARDLKPFARLNADPMVMEYLPRILDEKSSNKLAERFQDHFKQHGFGLYAAERREDGAFMGFVGLNSVDFKAAFTPAVEIAWRLDYAFWGQGYATEAAQRVLAHAFEDLRLKEIVSFTVHDNERTIHIMRKLGMVHDEKGDFDYPALRKGHPLGRFVLYRLSRKAFMAERQAA